MKRKKWIAALLALLTVLTLSPAALAQELPFPAEWFTGFGTGFSLRDLIDVNKGHIDLAGSSFQLENLIFFDDAVVGEDSEICLCQTTREAMILDESALPDGLRAEVRKEQVRIPDGMDGTQVAEEMRRERDGQPPADVQEIDPNDRSREAYYLYLVGKPLEEGEYLFVLWDGSIKLCSVTVLLERDQSAQISDGGASQSRTDSGDMISEWADTTTPMELPDDEQTNKNPEDLLEDILDGTVEDDMTQTWVDDLTGSITDWFDTIEPSTPTPYVPTPTPYVPTPTPYVPTPTPYVPTPKPAPTANVPTLPTPKVAISGSANSYTGDRAVLEARVSGGYDVSYQWYMGLGSYWSEIEGATDAQYRPDTSRPGTYAYLCRVISSGYGQTAYADSEPMVFTVSDRPVATPTPTPKMNKTVTGISIGKLPNKVDYNDGEAVDATGLQLRVRYSDGSYDTISSGYIVTTTNVAYNSTGLANVNVNYRGYQTSYQVKVHSVAELVRGIGVLTMPNKSSYTVGEYLNTAGLSIRVYSTDGRYLDVSEGFECSPTYFSTPGNQTVTISFMGKTCTFTVAVQQAKRITGLSIQSLPANRSYTVGDTINTAGLVLQLQTTNGVETVTSGFSISPRVATTAGSQQITVSYEGMSTSYTIDVRSNIPVAAPTPTPTPFGVTPTPTPFGTTPTPAPSGFPVPSASVSPMPTPVYTPAPARRNTGVGTAVKVLFVVAVVALGGLIGCVIYLRKTDGDDEYLDEPSSSEKLHRFFSKSDKDGRGK